MRQKLFLPRIVLFISGYIGLVISVIILLIRSLLAYGSVTFLPTCVLCFAHVLFCHLAGKMFIPHPRHSSALLYSFRCVCGLQYIGRTNQRLDARIKHVPTKIRLGNYFADRINNTYGSSTADHLINNRDCASFFSADLFTISSMSHSDFHQKVRQFIFWPINRPYVSRGDVYWVLIWLQFNIPFPAIVS